MAPRATLPDGAKPDGVDRLLATTLRLCAEALAFNAGKAGVP